VNWRIARIENIANCAGKSSFLIGSAFEYFKSVLAKGVGCKFRACWKNVGEAISADAEKESDYQFLSATIRTNFSLTKIGRATTFWSDFGLVRSRTRQPPIGIRMPFAHGRQGQWSSLEHKKTLLAF
jgi:hypothetical protein